MFLQVIVDRKNRYVCSHYNFFVVTVQNILSDTGGGGGGRGRGGGGGWEKRGGGGKKGGGGREKGGGEGKKRMGE